MKTILINAVFVLSALFYAGAQNGQDYKINSDLLITSLSENTYMHVSWSESEQFGRFSSNGMIYLANGKAYLFDSPVSEEQTTNLLRWIKDSLKADVAAFVPNHWHDDCMGGLAVIKQLGIPSFACNLTCEEAKKHGLPVPDSSFTDSLVFGSGEHRMICRYLGPGHTIDNIIVWIPSENILFAGCMVKALASKSPGYTADADMEQWPVTLKKVLDTFHGNILVIPGHGEPGGRELIEHTISLLR